MRAPIHWEHFLPRHRINHQRHCAYSGWTPPGASVFFDTCGLGVVTSIQRNQGDLELVVIFANKRIERLIATNNAISPESSHVQHLERIS